MLERYAVINIGHPDVRPIEELAEMIRAELDAPACLIETTRQPRQMTPEKRPALENMYNLLGVRPLVALEDGVRRVCQRVQERVQVNHA